MSVVRNGWRAVGLVAADGGPLTWPLHTSLLLAKEYAFTGDRISAARAKGKAQSARVFVHSGANILGGCGGQTAPRPDIEACAYV